jgi:hypothetical protein
LRCVRSVPEWSIAFIVLVIGMAQLVYPSSIETLTVNTYDGLILNSLSINVIVDSNDNVTLALNSQFEARGSQPIVDVSLETGTPSSNSFGNATVYVDLIGYYVAEGGKNLEWGTYSRRLTVVPTLFSNTVQYRIDLTEVANDTFNHFLSVGVNLSRENTMFAGRFFIDAQFGNCTGNVGDKKYLRFTPSFNGNITAIDLDITFPEISDLTTVRFGTEDMRKILPNRVRTSFSLLSRQGLSSEIYAEWKLPQLNPETPFWTRLVYDPWFIAVVGLIVGSIIGRYPWAWIEGWRERRQIAKKLVLELEKAKKSLKEHRPIDMAIYDSLSVKLLLLSDKTADLVRKAYFEIKTRENVGYTSFTSDPAQSSFEHQLEEGIKRINETISALKKEMLFRRVRSQRKPRRRGTTKLKKPSNPTNHQNNTDTRRP